jgi:predicted O-methyltransferase YrrM
MEEALGRPDPALQAIENLLLQEARTRSGEMRRNAYLTGDRPRPVSIAEDLERLSMPVVYRTFIHRLVLALRPGVVLELGTAHGMSATYITAALAADLGFFDDVLPGLVAQLSGPVDMVFDDGPHLPDVTLSAFSHIAPHLRSGSVYLMDDIDHQTGNRFAWEAVRNRPDVAASIEIDGRLGLCVWR